LQPEKKRLRDNVTALVFPGLIKMTKYLGTVPDFSKFLKQDGFWSDVKKPNPSESDEIWLMIHTDDLEKIEHFLT
jgi:hypothetical protein